MQKRLPTVGFANDCRYIPRDERAKQTIAGLIAAAKQADRVFIASDPDREGEVIGWHIAQVLKLQQPQRVVYQEITESAVKKAIASPRALDMNLIEAGRCRDCLDKLVGIFVKPHENGYSLTTKIMYRVRLPNSVVPKTLRKPTKRSDRPI